MDAAKATVLLQFPGYRLDGFDGDRSTLEATKVIANVPSSRLTVVELGSGVAAMWEAHGSVHESIEALLEPNKHTELVREQMGLPDPVLNNFEYDRVAFLLELRKAGVL